MSWSVLPPCHRSPAWIATNNHRFGPGGFHPRVRSLFILRLLDGLIHTLLSACSYPLSIFRFLAWNIGFWEMFRAKTIDWDVPALNRARDVDRMLRNTLEKKTTGTENLQPRRWILKFRPISTSALRKSPFRATRMSTSS